MFEGSLALTYFRAVYLALSSALPRFTVLFGMGRRGSRALWAPDIACRPVVFQQRNQFEKKQVEIAEREPSGSRRKIRPKVIGSSRTGN